MVDFDVAHPAGFNQIWTDAGSGAEENGAICEMVVPSDSFVALGHCCTFHPSGGTPPEPSVNNYYCVDKSQVTTGTMGAQIWNMLGSDVDTLISVYGSSAAVPFVDLHTFWANPGTDGPPNINPVLILLVGTALYGSSTESYPGMNYHGRMPA